MDVVPASRRKPLARRALHSVGELMVCHSTRFEGQWHGKDNTRDGAETDRRWLRWACRGPAQAGGPACLPCTPVMLGIDLRDSVETPAQQLVQTRATPEHFQDILSMSPARLSSTPRRVAMPHAQAASP